MWYVPLVVACFGLLTSTIVAGMALAALPRYLRERHLAVKQVSGRPGFTPPLTLLKPVHGNESGLECHLATFFEQDYPEYEILFCARDSADLGLETARRVAARYPKIPARFFSTGGHPEYINDKVISMELMEVHAAHEILVISDSDVRVTRDYLRSIALPFADSKVGAITCLYRGVAVQGGLWSRLDAVGMSVEMTAGVLVARSLEGMQFALGPTMAFRRGTIRRIGGFRIAADLHSDDFILGNETFKLGETVVLSHHVIDHIVLGIRLIPSLKHQTRWMKSTRFSRPRGHFGTALTFSVPYGLLAWAAFAALHHPWWGLALFAWSIATRLALSITIGRLVVSDTSWLNLLFLYPLRDLMGFGLWAASYSSRRIHWRGRIYELLAGGRMRTVK